MKKVISVLLTVLLVFQMATPVFAYTGDTIINTIQENQVILEKLQSLYGDELSEDDIVNELSNMGLLDEEGNLNVSESIMVDGSPMTLDQVKAMLNDDYINLNKIISVDGTNISLADLKTMIEIEDELARIKEKYFSNAVSMTEEHYASLDSLFAQIQNTGITLESTDIIINHDARIKAVASAEKITTDNSITIEFSLVDSNGDPISDGLDYDVSFDWRLLDGSAIKGTNYSNTGLSEGTVTLTAGQTTANASVSIAWIQTYSLAANRWNGDKVFLIQLYNPVNILFEGNTRAKDIPINIMNSYSWTTVIHSNTQNFEMSLTGDVGDPVNPGFNIIIDNTVEKNLLYAVNDIFGDISKASFDFNPYIILQSADGVFHTMSTYPILLDDGWNQINNATYGILEGINTINYYLYGQRKIEMDLITPNFEDPYGYQFRSRLSGELPGRVEFREAVFNPAYNNNRITVSSLDTYIEILDEEYPTVKAITAPAGSYYSGQAVPITVEFSEPVKASDVRLKNVNENILYSEESSGTISKYATFLYTVPKNPNRNPTIEYVSGITDMLGNTTSSSAISQSLTNVSMEIDQQMTFTGLSLVNEPTGGYMPDDIIEVRLDVDTSISQWLENDYNKEEGQLNSVYLKAGDYTYPLAMGGEGSQEGSYYTASIPASKYAGLSSQSLVIELYINGTYTPETHVIQPVYTIIPAYFSGGSLVIGLSNTADISSLILADSIILDTASYPENNIIYLTDTKATTLSASVYPAAASFPEIQWESSDDSVAVINATTGVITPVSKGTVKFRAVSLNGGFKTVYAETSEFIVADGGPPAIVFPEGNNAFVTKKNEEVKITWNQNLIARIDGTAAEFAVEIYEGNYANTSEVAGTPIYSDTVTDISTCIIPANILNKVSVGTIPSYTVKISCTNPYYSSEVLSSIGHIIVYPQPAKVELNELDSYYITDETSILNVDWTLSEFTGGDFEFKVVKNGIEIYKDNSSTGSSGSYILNIASVNDSLKDIYTVSVKAKNTQDSGWSTDSFVLHVYNKNSMNIMVDNQNLDSITMDNNSYIKNIYGQSGSEGVLALNRNISLKNIIGINYSQYPWGNITDQIKWKSSNTEIAPIKYRQGTIYENIEKFDYESYRPSTEFMLAGNSDGTATITATHAATGMKDSIEVNVKTLKDKLYIFNFYPKQETKLTYVNGNGEKRSLTSNSSGEIAVYEETGIASDITLKSGPVDNLYLGTLYLSNLISSEQDPGIYELYPVNIFNLRPAAKVELFFKNADGNPYTGQVTYRGAVYKNNKICTETMEKNGALLVIGSDGRFTLNLDTTKFWTYDNSEELLASDKLQFIYEAMFSEDYYPQLITVNGNLSTDDLVKFGESVINLKYVSAENKNKPFVVSHMLNYGLISGRTINVTNYEGSIGPSNIYASPDLETIVAWWGSNKTDGYDIKIEDEYGSAIAGQKVKTLLYPFATLAYSQNVTTLNSNALNLGIGEKKGAALSFYNNDGSLLRNTECPFTFTNMVGAPSADDDTKGVKGAVEDLNDSGNLEFDAPAINNGDSIIGKSLDLMSGTSLGGQLMNLKVIATEDPMVYRGLITMYQGMGSTDAGSVDVNIGGIEGEFDYTPDAAEMMDLMQKSTDDLEKELSENMEKAASGDVDYGLSITGYFEVEVRFDSQEQKWSMIVVGGGFDVDSLIGYTMKTNQMAGPIPLTAEFSIGAAAKLEFRAIRPYGNVPEGINAAEVNDFFTAMRINLYIKAFGGFGFDYSIVALKIGVFGQVNLLYDLEFLNRSYLTNGYDKIYGIELGLKGQVGIKFVAKLLFISYEAVLASAEYTTELWNEGNPELIEAWKNSQNSSMISAANGTYYNKMYALGNSLSIVKENVQLENRDYLELYDRVWGSASLRMRALASAPATVDIQSNAYPYANPVVTRDGVILAYISDGNSTDLNNTRASWAYKTAGGYEDKGSLPQISSSTAYADNNLKLDGTENFAAAVWEQQGVQITTESAITNEGISAMINSTDILASIYDGSTWSTTSITDNMVADMSPVVAANGDRAIVAWRSLAGSDMQDDPLTFDDVNDSILYKIYDNGAWSDTYTLYNGSSGNVKGLAASMMNDGTAGIAYTLDKGTENSNSSYGFETVCSVIGIDNSLVSDIRLTNNEEADENPQITVAGFGTEEGEKFVIGWHNLTSEGISDIKLAAIDNKGTICGGFIDSISSVNENSAVDISDTFRFAKGINLSVEDLSVVWVEQVIDYDETLDASAEKDCLKAVKFMRDENGKIYLTSALDVASMDNYTLIDHFDAYTVQKNAVNAVMLASSYTGELQDQGGGVYTVDSISSMKYSSATFVNDANVQKIYVNYDEIKNNFKTSMQFTVANAGITPINAVTVVLQPENASMIFDNLNILPNQALVLTVDYNVPSEADGIHDLSYTVSADFSNGDVIQKTGTLNIDLPDTGISKVELISDDQGERVIQTTLQNLSDVPLAGNSNRKVYVGFYTNSEYTEESKINVLQVEESNLSLLDESALTMRFCYTVPSTGIPSGGTRLYGRIWVEEKQTDGTFAEITEYRQSNNERSILLANPIEANNGNQFLVTVEQENTLDKTTAYVTIKNLSMVQSTNGNVIAYLLDSAGNIIETRLLGSDIGGLIALSGEESTTRDIVFKKSGAKVIAEYFTADPNAMNVGISDIKLLGLNMNYDSSVTDYSLDSINLGLTNVLAAAEKPQDIVEIRNSSGKVLASGKGSVVYALKLSSSNYTTAVQVAAKNEETGLTSDTYNINITNSINNNGTVMLSTSESNYNNASVVVTAENLSNFTPVGWQYEKNGTWSELFEWNSTNKFVINGAGTYTLSARVYDEQGYYIDSNNISVLIKKSSSSDNNVIVVPVITEPGDFNDVPEDAWFYEAVSFLAKQGIIKGVGNNMFAPDASVKRCDFLIMIMNAFSIAVDEDVEDNFADAGNSYYSSYIGTAKRMGLVAGMGDNLFAPENMISRQDMAVILYRILDKLDKLPTGTGGLDFINFNDKDEIADYAADSLRLFVETEALSGYDNSLNPRGMLTRAQAAQVLYNLLK